MYVDMYKYVDLKHKSGHRIGYGYKDYLRDLLY